jgi:hypothetical protein
MLCSYLVGDVVVRVFARKAKEARETGEVYTGCRDCRGSGEENKGIGKKNGWPHRFVQIGGLGGERRIFSVF